MTSSRDKHAAFAEAALPLVLKRIAELRALNYPEVRTLPEAAGQDLSIQGMKASLTVFRQEDAYALEGKTLVVVLAARPTMFGMGAQHVERGLVFSPWEAVRDATTVELQNSGG